MKKSLVLAVLAILSPQIYSMNIALNTIEHLALWVLHHPVCSAAAGFAVTGGLCAMPQTRSCAVRCTGYAMCMPIQCCLNSFRRSSEYAEIAGAQDDIECKIREQENDCELLECVVVHHENLCSQQSDQINNGLVVSREALESASTCYQATLEKTAALNDELKSQLDKPLPVQSASESQPLVVSSDNFVYAYPETMRAQAAFKKLKIVRKNNYGTFHNETSQKALS